MKKIKLSLAIGLLLLGFYSVNGQTSNVGIGTLTPNPSAILELSSDKMGFLAPRMDSTHRSQIATPVAGLLVFDESYGCYFYYSGSKWVSLCAVGAWTLDSIDFSGCGGPSGADGSMTLKTSIGQFVSPTKAWLTSGNSTSASDYIGTFANDDIRLATNNQSCAFSPQNQKMIIAKDGSVGIGSWDGTNAPIYPQNKLLVENGRNANFYPLLPPPNQIGILSISINAAGGNYSDINLTNSNHSSNISVLGVASGTASDNAGVIGNAQGDSANNSGMTAKAWGDNSDNDAVEAICHGNGGPNNRNCGVQTNVSGTGGLQNIGVEADMTGSAATLNYAMWGMQASAGSGTNDTLALCTTCPVNYAGYFEGDLFCSNTYYYSDPKLKRDISDYNNALEQLSKLEIKRYFFKNEEYAKLNLPTGAQIGMLSTNLKEVFPNLVKHSIHPKINKGDTQVDFEAVNYNALIPVLIEAVKELNDKTAENQDLKRKVFVLENQYNKLEEQLNDIYARIAKRE